MSIWGKIAGAAAGLILMGGPLGALLGAIAGHMMVDRSGGKAKGQGKAVGNDRAETRRVDADNGRERDEVAFTIGVIALAAKLAKADGSVSRDEVDAFKRVFPVPHEEEANVGQLFNLAKTDVAGFDAYARQLGSLFRGQPAGLEDLRAGLFRIAKADENRQPGDRVVLKHVAAICG
ncbi:MAG: TerB family tellurite resistance protein, partial [Alphaproteobacteria bacterium]